MTDCEQRGRPRTPWRRRALAGAAIIGTVGWLAPASVAQPTSPSLPPPAIHDLTVRIRDLQPSIRDLTPRVLDVRPAVTKTPTDTRITVSSDVLFAFGVSELSAGAQAVLSEVVKTLQSAPAGVVTVTGYTDSVGTDAFNLTLSQSRAEAVHAFLAAQVSRPGLTYRVVGMGKADPVAPNANPDGSDNPDGRRQNRRVTLSFRA